MTLKMQVQSELLERKSDFFSQNTTTLSSASSSMHERAQLNDEVYIAHGFFVMNLHLETTKTRFLGREFKKQQVGI